MTNEMDKATERPWVYANVMEVGSPIIRPRIYGPSERIAGDVVEQLICVCDSNGLYYSDATADEMDEEAKANAALIVKAVNNHDKLVAARQKAEAFAEWAEKMMCEGVHSRAFREMRFALAQVKP